jgi:hypothetical protein
MNRADDNGHSRIQSGILFYFKFPLILWFQILGDFLSLFFGNLFKFTLGKKNSNFFGHHIAKILAQKRRLVLSLVLSLCKIPLSTKTLRQFVTSGGGQSSLPNLLTRDTVA